LFRAPGLASPRIRDAILKVLSAEFVTSAAAGGAAGGIPRDHLPQVALAGRSNVGKSTLLNALCRRKIARTSAAPGKTRLANVYRVTLEGPGPGSWDLYLVDLPGYGYARGGADAATELAAVAEGYFLGARRSGFGADVRLASDATYDDHVSSNETSVASDNRTYVASDDSRTSDVRIARRRAALLLVDARHPGLKSDRQAARWLASMGVEYRVVATKIDKLSRSERARNVKALELTSGMPPLAVSAASGEGLDALWKTIASLARTGHA
jgi:GTP-binding protein